MLLPPAAFGQKELWHELQEKAITLYQNNKHEEAVRTQDRALKVAEKTFGPEDLKVAESLDNLAIYSQAVNDNKNAENYYRRALAILEKKLAPDDQYLAVFLDYVGDFLVRTGKEDEGTKLKERAKNIRRKKSGK